MVLLLLMVVWLEASRLLIAGPGPADDGARVPCCVLRVQAPRICGRAACAS